MIMTSAITSSNAAQKREEQTIINIAERRIQQRYNIHDMKKNVNFILHVDKTLRVTRIINFIWADYMCHQTIFLSHFWLA